MHASGETALTYDESAWGHEYLTANGLRFHAVTRGEGPPVLLVHGFPENWFSWRYQIDPIADAGFRAVAVDLRGYGGTDRPAGVSSYGIDPLCADFDGLVDALGGEPLHLVAHDWGAAIAWVFAGRHPDRLASLTILNGPHPKLFAHHLTRNLRQLRRSWYLFFYQLPWLPERMLSAGDGRAFWSVFRGWAHRKEMFPGKVVDRFRKPMLEPGALTAAVHYYRALFRNPRALAEARAFPRLSVPTSVFWAQDDRALGPELCDGLEGEFTGPYEYHPVEDCSHWVQQEQPELVNEYLVDFLRRMEKARQGPGD